VDIVRWEYRVLPVLVSDAADIQNELRRYGRVGWELVTLTPNPQAQSSAYVFLAVLKRRRPEQEDHN
jgi:hypothetical protein